MRLKILRGAMAPLPPPPAGAIASHHMLLIFDTRKANNRQYSHPLLNILATK